MQQCLSSLREGKRCDLSLLFIPSLTDLWDECCLIMGNTSWMFRSFSLVQLPSVSHSLVFKLHRVGTTSFRLVGSKGLTVWQPSCSILFVYTCSKSPGRR